MASDGIRYQLNFVEILRPIKQSRILLSLETSEFGYLVTRRNNPVKHYSAA
jgi:hypothetical protein